MNKATTHPLDFLHRRLDPAESLGEIIFGLIMVLTFTIGARLASPEDAVGPQELLVAAIGCNLAWGIIDAALYVLGCVYARSELTKLVRSVQASSNASAALDIIRDELDPVWSPMTDSPDREQVYQAILQLVRRARPVPNNIQLEDLRGAHLTFWLVFLTALPAAFPFMIIDDADVALRTSNTILVLLLFVVGYLWGKRVNSKPWLAGMSIALIGLALVLIAIPLGG